MQPQALGVGLSYSSGIEPLLERHGDLVDVVEVEPQTFWYSPGREGGPYRFDPQTVERLRSLPVPKVLHGVGNPIGGSAGLDQDQLGPFGKMADLLGAVWVSEHLSFNRARGRGGAFYTGFMLPPRQTPAGVEAAARAARELASQVNRPLALETGVNYLQPRPDEMPDGRFAADVVRAADCGLLLDIHNVWANERNGRQPVREFLDQLPLERVWELHVAGGFERDGYYLDAHSGAVPEPLLDLTRELVLRLPSLRAIVFELFPSFLPALGIDGLRAELERLRELWEARTPTPVPTTPPVPVPAQAPPRGGTPQEWEDALGALVLGRDEPGALVGDLAKDPAIAVLRRLIGDFRASMVAGTLKLTTRLLLFTLGPDTVRSLLEGFWRAHPPELFASQEAEGFARHLAALELELPHLRSVLAFERAAIATMLDGTPRVVPFDVDPLALLGSLGDGRLPRDLPAGRFEVEITPDRVEDQGYRDEAVVSWHH
jgi:uncharacterized protein (UPF0276 family)